jgi:diguanylate cyclase (GGDEF)-like protein
MLNFDPRSFIATSAVAGILCTLIFFVLRRSFPKTIGGIGEWGWACLATVGGAFMLGSRDMLPPFFSIVLANLLIVTGVLLMHVSVRRFAGMQAKDRHSAILLLAVVASLVWLTMIFDNYRGRLIAITLVNMSLFAASAVVISRMKKRGFPEHFTSVAFAIAATVSFIRFVFAATGLGSSDYRNDNTLIQSVYMSTFSFSLIALSFGFMLMVTTRMQEKLQYAASHDDLSGAYTRSIFFELMAKEIERSRRHGNSLSLLIMDLDDFKLINDSHGHPMGDKVIKTFAEIASNELRTQDVFCRYGGEEFALLLPNTSLDEAAAVAERIRNRFSNATLVDLPAFTVSIGVESTHNKQLDMTQLIEGADQALYIAKNLGKNRVETAPDRHDARVGSSTKSQRLK